MLSTYMYITVVLLYTVTLSTTAQDAAPYYGKEVGSLKQFSHEVSGKVYVVDDRHILIRQLNYDGMAPAAYFWIGLKGKSNSQPDKSGIAILDENGSKERIKRRYNQENIVLTMNAGIKTSDLLWFSIWCKKFLVNFGHVDFPSDLIPPRPMIISQFNGGPDNSVHSGPISIQDHKTILVEKFTFTGSEKDVLFVAGRGAAPMSGEEMFKIPRANGALNFLKPVKDVNVTLTFPDQLTVFDVDYVSVYSESSATSLGQVSVPAQLNVPPKLVE